MGGKLFFCVKFGSMKPQMKPQIAVIIPSYNRAPLLPRAVDSVLAQSFKAFELIIIDDGSHDHTREVLKPYLSKPGVRVIHSPHQGVSGARNQGVRQSQAPWLAFLDSDDEWKPDKLEKQWALTPHFSIIHGEEIWIRHGLRLHPLKKHKKSGGDIFSQAVKLCCISPSTVLMKKTLFWQVGGFREDFPVCEDYDLWLKVTAHHRVGFVEDPLVIKYGGHRDQLSRAYVAMDYWRVLALDHIQSSSIAPEKARLAQVELLKKAWILLKGYEKHGHSKDSGEFHEILKIYQRTEQKLTGQWGLTL